MYLSPLIGGPREELWKFHDISWLGSPPSFGKGYGGDSTLCWFCSSYTNIRSWYSIESIANFHRLAQISYEDDTILHFGLCLH